MINVIRMESTAKDNREKQIGINQFKTESFLMNVTKWERKTINPNESDVKIANAIAAFARLG